MVLKKNDFIDLQKCKEELTVIYSFTFDFLYVTIIQEYFKLSSFSIDGVFFDTMDGSNSQKLIP